jgi:hypothetical protein
MRQHPLLGGGQRANGLTGKRYFLCGRRRWLCTQQWIQQQTNNVFCAIRAYMLVSSVQLSDAQESEELVGVSELVGEPRFCRCELLLLEAGI